MKLMRTAVALAFALAFGNAYAFHDGGVAYCDGCHTMHNSSGNKAMAKKGASTQFQGLNYLLQGSDDSSTCLNCHASGAGGGYHILTYPAPATGTAPLNYTPAGDFAWLTIASAAGTKTSYGAPISIPGERHGHNVVAGDFGLVADATLTTAPGGSYVAANLACTSCHDPHSRARVIDVNGTIAYNQLGAKTLPISGSGSYGGAPTGTEAVGVYRLLGGKNYVVDSTGYQFTNADPPVAVAPSTYNRSETVSDVRVAYGQGMSEWCANCHTSIHNDGVGSGNTKLIHPAGNAAKINQGTTVWGVTTTEAGIYNAYKASGDLTNSQTTSYLSLVPYEEGTGVLATLATDAGSTSGTASLAGPTTGTENVACISCHRAHATGFPSMTRWSNAGEFLTLGGVWPGTDATGEATGGQYSLGLTQAQYQAAMYGRPASAFATYQRSLCNKCHGKD